MMSARDSHSESTDPGGAVVVRTHQWSMHVYTARVCTHTHTCTITARTSWRALRRRARQRAALCGKRAVVFVIAVDHGAVARALCDDVVSVHVQQHSHTASAVSAAVLPTGTGDMPSLAHAASRMKHMPAACTMLSNCAMLLPHGTIEAPGALDRVTPPAGVVPVVTEGAVCAYDQ
jgi:hypothetical protein